MTAKFQCKDRYATLAIKYSWDFVLGVLLIGGAPLSVIALLMVVSDFLEKHTQVVVSGTASFVIFGIVLIVAVVVFGAAVGYRTRKRLLPLGFIVLELLVGVFAAVLFFIFLALIDHYVMD